MTESSAAGVDSTSITVGGCRGCGASCLRRVHKAGFQGWKVELQSCWWLMVRAGLLHETGREDATLDVILLRGVCPAFDDWPPQICLLHRVISYRGP